MDRAKFNLDVVRGTTSGSGQREPSTPSTNTLTAMDRPTAVKLVRRLLAGYPVLGAHDPEAYMAALIDTMSRYPAWAGERTIIRVDRDGDPKFPPAEAQLRKWLEEAVQPIRYAEEWSAAARRQIAQRPPNASQPVFSGVKGDGGPGTIYSNYDLAVKNHGRPKGYFEA